MPNLGAYFHDDEAPQVLAAAKAAGEKRNAYIVGAVRERMKREGHVPGTPEHDIRAEAVAAAELYGPQAVLSALQQLRTASGK